MTQAAVASKRERLTPAERRRRLLEVAAEVIARKGYDAASMQDIASELGILKGSLYYYIDTKEDLLYELIISVHDRIDGEIAEIARGVGSPGDRLSRIVEMHVRNTASQFTMAQIFMSSFRHLTGDRRDEIRRRRHESETVVVELMAAGQRSGDFSSEIDPFVAAMGYFGTVNWFVQWYRPGKHDIDVIAPQLANYVVAGVRGEREFHS